MEDTLSSRYTTFNMAIISYKTLFALSHICYNHARLIKRKNHADYIKLKHIYVIHDHTMYIMYNVARSG